MVSQRRLPNSMVGQSSRRRPPGPPIQREMIIDVPANAESVAFIFDLLTTEPWRRSGRAAVIENLNADGEMIVRLNDARPPSDRYDVERGDVRTIRPQSYETIRGEVALLAVLYVPDDASDVARKAKWSLELWPRGE